MLRFSLFLPLMLIWSLFLSDILHGAEFDINPLLKQLSWQEMQADIEMTLQRDGQESLLKELVVYLRDRKNGQDLMTVFTSPSNMKGTAFLALCNQDLDDRWFLYLRTLRRAKRLPPSPENFMLRDFLSLYLVKPRPELWTFRSEEVTLEGQKLLKITALAKTNKTKTLTGYHKLEHLVDPTRNFILKTDFFSEDGKLMRRQQVLKSQKINGIWLPVESKTNDYEEKVSAQVFLKNIQINPNIPDKIFTPGNLKTF